MPVDGQLILLAARSMCPITHTSVQSLTPGQRTSFEIGILPIAHRLETGHRLRIALTSNDTRGFAMQHLSHYPLGLPTRNRIDSTSCLTIPLIPEVP